MADLERNKRTVTAFYTRAFTDHEPADAVAQYVGPEYIQHNPDTPDGLDAFVHSAIAFIAKFPRVNVEVKRVIAEGDLVVAHICTSSCSTAPTATSSDRVPPSSPRLPLRSIDSFVSRPLCKRLLTRVTSGSQL